MAGNQPDDLNADKAEADSFLIPIPEKKLTCIEYPGRVVNVERALETLGGNETLSHTILQSGQRLALRFRPRDDFCRPLYASKYSTTNMLLKVTRKKKNASHSGESVQSKSADEPATEYACEMIGTVDNTFKFEGMCDFQYLPMVPNADGSFKPVLNDLVPTSVEDSSFLKKEAPLFIMPGNFSRMDTPSGYLYQKQKCGPDPLLEENLIGKRRRRRPGSAYLVPFDVEVVPTEPQEEARQSVYRMKLKDELELLTKLFQERPMWSRSALLVCSKLPISTLKVVLPMIAFYFLSGPWRTAWCRLGHDPRKDKESRMYQVVDFRMRNKVLAKAKALIQPARVSQVNVLVNQHRHLNKGASVPSRVAEEDDDTLPCFSPKIVSDANYILQEDLLPAHYQMCYQFCDLHAVELRQIIDTAKVNEECDPRSGWWRVELCNQLRDKMSEIVERTVHKILAKEDGKSSMNQMDVDEGEEEVDEEEEDEEEEEEEDLLDNEGQEDDESDPGTELLDYIEQPMDT